MMDMVQAHKGYFKADGRFSAFEKSNFTVPQNVTVYLIVTDESLPTSAKNEPFGDDDGVSFAERQEAFEALRGVIPPDFKYNLEDIREERIKKRGLVD